MKIWKRILVCLLIFLGVGIIVFLLNGFKMKKDMEILSFTAKDNHITIKVSTPSSSGYVRAIKVKDEGEKKYLDFYETFGFFNSKLGSKDEFSFEVSDEVKEVYIRDGKKYSLVLAKDESDEWELEGSNDEGFTEKELADMEYVDEKVEELMKSEHYLALEVADRALEMEKLLELLEKEGYVRGVSYTPESYIFGFEYSCGALGGVMVKGFDPMLNGSDSVSKRILV